MHKAQQTIPARAQRRCEAISLRKGVTGRVEREMRTDHGWCRAGQQHATTPERSSTLKRLALRSNQRLEVDLKVAQRLHEAALELSLFVVGCERGGELRCRGERGQQMVLA
eukprot:scaffold1449_cov69-Phaeocystis_antarctica.AAC.2